jgi:Fe-S-cluster containining protein
MTEDIERFKEKILREYPRLGKNDTFGFACYKSIECFNKCCADVNILLTPFDVLRMKKRLGMDSGVFLDKYTILPIGPKQKLPIPILRMAEDDRKRCPFVDSAIGCTIYEDRPWPCRMYPIGQASPDDASGEKEFYFIVKDDICLGHQEDQQWTIAEWMEDQGVREYDELGEIFKEITLHPKIQHGPPLEPKKTDMYFMACYDLDRFRRFLFDTKFFMKFDVEESRKERLAKDDVELLKFGLLWLKFCLFGEKTMKIKQEVVEATLAEYQQAEQNG